MTCIELNMKESIRTTEQEPQIKEKRTEVMSIMMKAFNKCGVKIPAYQKYAFEETLWLMGAFMSGSVPVEILAMMSEIAVENVESHIPQYTATKESVGQDIMNELAGQGDVLVESIAWLAYLKGAFVSGDAYAKELLVSQVMLKERVY